MWILYSVWFHLNYELIFNCLIYKELLNIEEEYIYLSKRGVVAITPASHAGGRGFDPRRLYFLFPQNM